MNTEKSCGTGDGNWALEKEGSSSTKPFLRR